MKLSFENVKKGIRFLKHYGWKEFRIRLKEKQIPEEISYIDWWKKHQVSEEELKKQRQNSENWMKKKNSDLVSILVPCYKTPEAFLREMIESVQNQSYPNWELCLVDASDDLDENRVWNILMEYAKNDSRIRAKQLNQNKGIAENTNEAYRMANGEYVALLDHDDLLAPNALYEMLSAVLGNESKPGLVYSDEDKVTENLEHYAPHFKPEFNLDLIRSNNYITHFTMIQKSVLEALKMRDGFVFDSKCDGAQDYDLILRTCDYCRENDLKISHVAKVLYHWRMHSESTAANQSSKTYAFDAGKEAIQAHLNRNQVDGYVEAMEPEKHAGFYRVHYAMPKEQPLVSIIIPNKDEKVSLEKCLNSIAKSSYSNYEIIIVENNSTSSEIFDFYKTIETEGKKGPGSIRVVTWQSNGQFNYSALNNYGASFATGKYLMLLNNDIEILSPDWLEEMISICNRNDVAAVGARLYYPDDSIQHAGIVVGVGGYSRGIASNMFVGTRRINDGYLHKAGILLDYSAVTAACMLVKKEAFDKVGGFTEKLSVAFNDVDLCLKLRRLGYLIVYDPFVEAYHYESKSRGQEDTPEKVQRFQEEIEYMRTEWNEILRNGDPYYNPNLSRVNNNYSLNPN